MATIFEKVSFDPYNFRITRLSARKSEHDINYEEDSGKNPSPPHN